MALPRISLEQWTVLVSVVESGGYEKAAASINRSQSTLTYAIQKLERLLDVKVFERQGRRSVLTPTGALLYRRGKHLVEEAARLELAAGDFARGWEPEIRLAVEIVFPTWLLVRCLGDFAVQRPGTRIELYETVLGGTDEALVSRKVDFAIGPAIPQGFVGDLMMPIRAVCVAAPSHPLHALGRPPTLEDLERHTHLVVRDSGALRERSSGWLNETRWTVTNKATSIHAVTQGLGYAWLPEEAIRHELDSGELKPLPLASGAVKHGNLYLIHADPEAIGPGAKLLAGMLRARVQEECRAATAPA